MASGSKTDKDIYISLDKLYEYTNTDIIIKWLDEIKKGTSEDGKVRGLLNKKRIQIITTSENGEYNLILSWIKDNIDKFADYDFTGVPDSAFISLASQYSLRNIEYELQRWVSFGKLSKELLSENPNAIDFLKKNPDKIVWEFLSLNPNAIEMLKANPEKIDWSMLSSNPSAIEMLKANPEKIDWHMLSSNPSAIEMLKANPEKIDWENLSLNSGAIEMLKANRDKINWNILSKNEKAIELLQENPKRINWKILSANPNPKAFEMLKANPTKINWRMLSANPNAIELLQTNLKNIDWSMLSSNPAIFKAIVKKKENYEYKLLSWIPINKLKNVGLSKNPNAIDFLKKNPEMIKWNMLSKNEKAIELLREKIAGEKKINQADLDILPYYEKIDWNFLSRNPNAIELLKENFEKINWDGLSENPNAFDLLRDKVNKENGMSKSELRILKTHERINWGRLSINPCAIEILKANPEKIDWIRLSLNKNAIEMLRENPEKIDWMVLSGNSGAIELLKENPEKIDWSVLSGNPSAIELLKENPEKIDWGVLSENENAIEMLKANPKKINWDMLLSNPAIFELVEEEKEKQFKTVDDVEIWCKNPEIHPTIGIQMSVVGIEYYNIYVTAYKIMKKADVTDDIIIDKFPKNHLLFGDIDLIYYSCVKNNVHEYDRLYEGNGKQFALCKLLAEKIEMTQEKDTIFETELELLRARFMNNNTISILFDNYKRDLVDSFLDVDYIGMYDFPERMQRLEEDSYNIEGYWFKNFLENNKLANGEIIIKYFINTIKKPNPPLWITNALKIYNDYKPVYNDIYKCFNPESGVIKNIEDKSYKFIKDPLDDYFEDFEKKLEEIRKPKYSQLIDLTTFKPKKNLKYLNNEQYKEYKKTHDTYYTKWEKYDKSLKEYETSKSGKSPTPPEKPKITLPWGKEHTIAKEIDPIHIKDDIIKSFEKEYEKAKPIIDEYNKIKNMSYLKLKKYAGSSPTSASKQIMKENKLLSMTREEINEQILFDYSDLADKCSESIDILTNEELDDANYPLSKLQLMARLKVYTPDKKKYRTECIYAPKLYNYLIKCINAKEPFINPVTKAKYTQENIDELMNVMKIIDSSIEVPVFIEHRHDSGLKIKYNTYESRIDDFDNDRGFGSIRVLNFHKIYISRVIGGVEHLVYNLCNIPADIEATGEFGTGSTDLTSSTMLFRIFKLFKDGRLLHNYIPPYRIPRPDTYNQYLYIKPLIHFNRYEKLDNWLWSSTNKGMRISKDEFVDRFKHYAQEINNYIF
jgi:hypothetical protein